MKGVIKFFRFFLAVLVTAGVVMSLATATWAAELVANTATFSDVLENSQFFVPIQYLSDHGLVKGYSDGTFRPYQEVNRAEALAVIMRVAGIDTDQSVATADAETTASSTPPYRDVTKNKWFYATVSSAKSLGLVTGFENGKYFRPSRDITLVEALRMFFAAQHIDTNNIAGNNTPKMPPNIAPDAWYTNDVLYALSLTMISQQESGRIFAPDAPLHRGELALLIYRFLKNKETSAQFGFASWYGDGLSKVKIKDPAGAAYADRSLTAAHKEFPYGTILRVTNMENGKYVDVVVNDSGPYVTGRVVDLSKSAFAELENPGTGIIMVQVTERRSAETK